MATHKQDAAAAASSKPTTEFVNHGLLLWNENRQKWGEHSKATTRSQLLHLLKSRRRECTSRKMLVWRKDKHKMLESDKPFRKPVPLGEMVDFLADAWEEEGLYEI